MMSDSGWPWPNPNDERVNRYRDEAHLLTRERDEAVAELAVVRAERDELREAVRLLRKTKQWSESRAFLARISGRTGL